MSSARCFSSIPASESLDGSASPCGPMKSRTRSKLACSTLLGLRLKLEFDLCMAFQRLSTSGATPSLRNLRVATSKSVSRAPCSLIVYCIQRREVDIPILEVVQKRMAILEIRRNCRIEIGVGMHDCTARVHVVGPYMTSPPPPRRPCPANVSTVVKQRHTTQSRNTSSEYETP